MIDIHNGVIKSAGRDGAFLGAARGRRGAAPFWVRLPADARSGGARPGEGGARRLSGCGSPRTPGLAGRGPGKAGPGAAGIKV